MNKNDKPIIKLFTEHSHYYVYDTYFNTILEINQLQYKELISVCRIGVESYLSLSKELKEYHDVCMLIRKGFLKTNIIDRVEIINNIAITMNYKGIKLLGYKYNIYFKENSFAQELANFITVTGLLEKNSSLGCGFVKAYYK